MLLFMLQHGRPGNRPDKHHVSLGYSPPPTHHHLRRISQIATAFSSKKKKKTCTICSPTLLSITCKHGWSLICVQVFMRVVPGCLSPWRDLPVLAVTVLLPQLSRGGPPWAHTKHIFFSGSLMRAGRRVEGVRERGFGKWGGGFLKGDWIFQNSRRECSWLGEIGSRMPTCTYGAAGAALPLISSW